MSTPLLWDGIQAVFVDIDDAAGTTTRVAREAPCPLFVLVPVAR